jgi:serine/threonine-protein kinase
MAVRHPDTGEAIGDDKVVARLGAGGLGVVPMDGRTNREIGILRR